MKKILSALLIILFLLGVSACANDSQGEQNQPMSSQPAAPNNNMKPSVPAPKGFGLVYKGVVLIPGGEYPRGELPEPEYYYIDATDAQGGETVIYNFHDLELSVYRTGNTAVIHKISVINPYLKTREGLALGDPLADVVKIYGNIYTVDGDVWSFTNDRTEFTVLTQDGFVAGIEYRLRG